MVGHTCKHSTQEIGKEAGGSSQAFLAYVLDSARRNERRKKGERERRSKYLHIGRKD